MNYENNNNPNNVNSTEDSLFSDMPPLISDSDSDSDSEYENESSDTDSENDAINAYMPELISDYESEDESETDYSDMPELISMEQLELINNLCKPFINNQDLHNTTNIVPIYSIDSEDNEDSEYDFDFINPIPIHYD